MATMRTYGDGCGIAHALDLVGERWALLVVRELLLGPKRFTDLRGGLPNASPNVLAGGKRPRTTLTPTVVLKDGRPFLAIGTPGGDSQDQQILLVLLNIIDFKMDVQAP